MAHVDGEIGIEQRMVAPDVEGCITAIETTRERLSSLLTDQPGAVLEEGGGPTSYPVVRNAEGGRLHILGTPIERTPDPDPETGFHERYEEYAGHYMPGKEHLEAALRLAPHIHKGDIASIWVATHGKVAVTIESDRPDEEIERLLLESGDFVSGTVIATSDGESSWVDGYLVGEKADRLGMATPVAD